MLIQRKPPAARRSSQCCSLSERVPSASLCRFVSGARATRPGTVRPLRSVNGASFMAGSRQACLVWCDAPTIDHRLCGGRRYRTQNG